MDEEVVMNSLNSPDIAGPSVVNHEPSTIVDQCNVKLEEMINKCTVMDLSGQVSVGRRIGWGGFADVHRGTWNGKLVAIKFLKALKGQKDEAKWEKRLNREMKVHAVLYHPNIIEFHGYIVDLEKADFPGMVSEFCERGNAADFLAEQNSPLEKETALDLAKGVSDGLKYLHSLGVVHGDLKPANILITDDGTAQLCDFGLVYLTDWQGPDINTSDPRHGTMRYKAPELLRSEQNKKPWPSFQSDIYALGCVVYEFIYQKYPFHDYNTVEEVINELKSGLPPAPTPVNLQTQFLLILWEHLRFCWEPDSRKRPTAAEVLSTLSVLYELSSDEEVFHSEKETTDNDNLISPREIMDHFRKLLPSEDELWGRMSEKLGLNETVQNNTRRPSSQQVCKLLMNYASPESAPYVQILAFKSIVALIARYPLLREDFLRHDRMYYPTSPQEPAQVPLKYRFGAEWEYYSRLASFAVRSNNMASMVVSAFNELGMVSDDTYDTVEELLKIISYWGISNRLGILAIEYLRTIIDSSPLEAMIDHGEKIMKRLMQLVVQLLEQVFEPKDIGEYTLEDLEFKARSLDLLMVSTLTAVHRWIKQSPFFSDPLWFVDFKRTINLIQRERVPKFMPKSREHASNADFKDLVFRALPEDCNNLVVLEEGAVDLEMDMIYLIMIANPKQLIERAEQSNSDAYDNIDEMQIIKIIAMKYNEKLADGDSRVTAGLVALSLSTSANPTSASESVILLSVLRRLEFRRADSRTSPISQVTPNFPNSPTSPVTPNSLPSISSTTISSVVAEAFDIEREWSRESLESVLELMRASEVRRFLKFRLTNLPTALVFITKDEARLFSRGIPDREIKNFMDKQGDKRKNIFEYLCETYMWDEELAKAVTHIPGMKTMLIDIARKWDFVKNRLR